MTASLSVGNRKAVKEIVNGRGRYGSVLLDPHPEDVAEGFVYSRRSCLEARRGRTHLGASLDIHPLRLAGHPHVIAWRLAMVGAERVSAATNTRRTFIYGVGTYTNVHCLRSDAMDIFTALAAIDQGDARPADALTAQWAETIRTLAEKRTPKSRDWILRRLDSSLNDPVPEAN